VRNTRGFAIELLLALALLAGSCQGLPSPSSPPREQSSHTTAAATQTPQPVTLTIWHGWQPEFLVAVESIFRGYEATHPNVKIELVNVPDIGTRIASAIPGGERVDILAFGSEWVGRLEPGFLVDAWGGMLLTYRNDLDRDGTGRMCTLVTGTGINSLPGNQNHAGDAGRDKACADFIVVSDLAARGIR